MLDHKHMVGSTAVRNPFVDVDVTVDWFKRLVEAVGMKIVAGPMVAYCKADNNEGIAGAVCIETSHCSLHIWDKMEVPFAKFDLYSCKSFDPTIVVNMLKEMDPYWYEYIILDRNRGTKVIARHSEQLVPVKSLLPNSEQVALDAALAKRSKNRLTSDKAVIARYHRMQTLYEL